MFTDPHTSIFADFGVEVTLIEASPMLVPIVDQDASEALGEPRSASTPTADT